MVMLLLLGGPAVSRPGLLGGSGLSLGSHLPGCGHPAGTVPFVGGGRGLSGSYGRWPVATSPPAESLQRGGSGGVMEAAAVLPSCWWQAVVGSALGRAEVFFSL